MTQHTTCPNCQCTDLIRYSSLNMKQCPDCKTLIPWGLSPGQLPLVGSNRQRVLTRLTDSSILSTRQQIRGDGHEG